VSATAAINHGALYGAMLSNGTTPCDERRTFAAERLDAALDENTVWRGSKMANVDREVIIDQGEKSWIKK